MTDLALGRRGGEGRRKGCLEHIYIALMLRKEDSVLHVGSRDKSKSGIPCRIEFPGEGSLRSRMFGGM